MLVSTYASTLPAAVRSAPHRAAPRRAAPGAMSRPELAAPADVFYNEAEARKYTAGSRMVDIQEKLTHRALELLALPEGEPKLLLDIGCGSGLSGECLSDAGHLWVGSDISTAMLQVAVERDVSGDVLRADMGQGLGYRAGTFDGAISISAVQWLCSAERSSHDPRARLRCFFTSLYKVLARGARAVLQIYPDGHKQAEMITTAAMRAGFSGGLVVDYPNSTRAKKYFLTLLAGQPNLSYNPQPRLGSGDSDSDSEGEEGEGGGAHGRASVKNMQRERSGKRRRANDGGVAKGSVAWIHKKKQQRRARGEHVKSDSRYTGRKRKPGGSRF
mmetsp:Transcript_4874/g.17678  ORF Transcript_4874/g.17678 Transcript_4874/m.17678 type:complete len:330 (-) Transcript_4874:93-1082(-)